MTQRQDIDKILRDWPYASGAVTARLIRAEDGRELLQMRIELGLLQMETTNRPDGTKPGGTPTYLEHLFSLVAHSDDTFQLSEEECIEVDREFYQYYQRRICWLELHEFNRALDDANHTLQLMDLVAKHSPDEEWTQAHEQYRPLVLFHRTQAAALAELEDSGAERAMEEIGNGLVQIQKVFENFEMEEYFDEDELVQQLKDLREWMRDHYKVGRTLAEQLADAVAAEEYELAAKIRDKIARRGSKGI